MRATVGLGLAIGLLASASVLPAQAEGNFAGFIGSVLRDMEAVERPAPQRRAPARRAPVNSKRWLVIASREGPQEAVALAESYAPTLGATLVMESRNGRYAVLAGTLAQDRSKINLETLKTIRLIPQDSFLSDGRNLDRVVWHSFPDNSSLDLMTRPTYRQSVRRLQIAFGRLGLYDGPSDGLIGISTADAFRRFERRFGTPPGEIVDDLALARIEETAVDGFGSPAERALAQAGGFGDAASFNEARAGGFPSATSFNQARSMGFASRQDFDEGLAGGFRSGDEFVRARAGGFRNAASYSEARRDGFETASEHQAFRTSGFRDAASFREAARAGYGDERSWREARAKALQRAREAAELRLSDADAFLRLNPASPHLLAIAKAAADLKATAGGSDPDAISAANARLGDALAAEAGFAAFAARRESERAAADAGRRTELGLLLERDRAGLSAWVAANLSAPALPDVVSELDRLGRDRASPEIATLEEAHRRVEALLREKGLAAQIELLQRPAEAVEALGAAADRAITQAATRTPLNAVLLDGSPEDVVVLYNADPRAPSLARNLRGDFSFRTGTAALCTLGVERTPALQRALETALGGNGAQRLELGKSDCGPGDIAARDLLVMQRRAFLDAATALAVPVLEALETKRLRPYPALAFADLQRRVAADEALASAIETDLASGGREGFGAVLAERGAVCAVGAEPRALHEPALRELARLARRGEGEPPIRAMEAEDAFQAARRGECGAIYTDGTTLVSMREALEREGVAVALAPLWRSPEDLETARAEFEKATTAARAESEARRLAAEADRVATERRRREQAARIETRERELRSRHETEANALLNRFLPVIERFVRGEGSADEVRHLATLFPRFASWRGGLSAEGWEPVSAATTLADYGMADWQGRSVEAVAMETRVRTVSRERGRYAERCFLLAAVVDDEFTMERDPMETDCEGGRAALATWTAGHKLLSRWRVTDAAPPP